MLYSTLNNLNTLKRLDARLIMDLHYKNGKEVIY